MTTQAPTSYTVNHDELEKDEEQPIAPSWIAASESTHQDQADQRSISPSPPSQSPDLPEGAIESAEASLPALPQAIGLEQTEVPRVESRVISGTSTLVHPLPEPRASNQPDTIPTSSASRSSSTRGLTQQQLNFVQRLSEQNVTGAALTAVIESMLSGGGGGEELEPTEEQPIPRAGEDIPPGYDFTGHKAGSSSGV